MAMQLSEHFTLEELIFSQNAVRLGLDNTPGPPVVGNLTALCANVLEPLRAYVAMPLQISSGYRAPAVNAAAHGAPNSQHVEGKAADVLCPAIGTVALFRAVIRSAVAFDQLIFEGTWVHVSYAAGANRGTIMRAHFHPGQRTTYEALTRDRALALV